MKKELKLSIAILSFSLILLTALIVVKSKSNNIDGYNIISPLSSNKSVLAFSTKDEKPKKIIYGYLPYWSLEKIKYLQLDKLTDIAYFGLYLDKDGNFIKTKEGEGGELVQEPGYVNWNENEDLDKLIEISKEFGVRISLTVIAHVDEDIDEFLDCRECWNTLLENLKIELDKKGIVDINLNFEHAEGTNEGIDKKFSELTKYLNDELDKVYGNSYVVVSAFADSATQNRVSSDLENLSRAADGIFIMAYDYHRPVSEEIGPVAPIQGPGIDVMETINDFLTKMPPNKIILGVPYYGYNWLVDDESEYSKRSEGSDEKGYSGAQAYDHVMETIIENRPFIKWNENGKSPYFTYISKDSNHLRTVYYENAKSLKYKYDIVKDYNLGGVGIWALGYEGGYTELWELLYDSFIK